jgi:hypothetical protein
MQASKLLLALALATATALRHAGCNRNTALQLQLRGGSDDDNGEGLFGGEAVDDDAGGEGLFGGDDDDEDEETIATKRYAAAVAQLKKNSGECPALEEFEAESLKPDRDESKLALLWMDVKLQNLQKKQPDDYKGGKAFDASHAYARGVAFLATECGAYVEAEKLTEKQHAAFCETCAAALEVDGTLFRATLRAFEANLGQQLHEGVAQRVKLLRAALARDDFAEKAFASLQSRESKILEHVSSVEKVEELRRDMLATLDQAAGDAVEEAQMCQQLIPAVEAMLGGRLGAGDAEAAGPEG